MPRVSRRVRSAATRQATLTLRHDPRGKSGLRERRITECRKSLRVGADGVRGPAAHVAACVDEVGVVDWLLRFVRWRRADDLRLPSGGTRPTDRIKLLTAHNFKMGR